MMSFLKDERTPTLALEGKAHAWPGGLEQWKNGRVSAPAVADQ